MRLRVARQFNTTQIKIAAFFAGFLLIVGAIVGIVSLVNAAGPATYTAPSGGTVKTWDGGGGDNKLGTAANWVGDTAIANGDSIILPDLSVNQPLINDLSNSIYLQAVFVDGTTATSNSFTYTVTGSDLQIASGGSVTVSGTSTALSIASLTSQGDITINGNGTSHLLFTGSVVVNGTLTVPGLTTPGAPTPNNGGDVDGSFKVTGSLSVQNSLSLVSPVTIDAAGAGVTVTSGALNVGSGAGLIAGNVTISGSGTSTFAGTQTITGNLSVANGTLSLGSAFTTSAPTITTKTLDVTANISALTIPSITVTDTNGLTLTTGDNLSATDLTVSGSGATANLSVNNGATLTATNVTVNGSGTSTLAPGSTNNITTQLNVTTGTLNLSQQFTTNAPAIDVKTLSLGADVVGTGNDRVKSLNLRDTASTTLNNNLTVLGAVTTAGPLTISSGKTLTTINSDVTVTGLLTATGTITTGTGKITADSVTIAATTGSLTTNRASSPALSVLTGNLTNNGSMTVGTGGISVPNNGVTALLAAGSTNNVQGTLSVPNGTLTVASAFTGGNAPAISVKTFNLNTPVTSPAIASLTISDTVATSITNNLTVTGAIRTTAAGLTTSAAVNAGSVQIDTGNLTVSSSSLNTTNGNVAVSNGNLILNGALGTGTGTISTAGTGLGDVTIGTGGSLTTTSSATPALSIGGKLDISGTGQLSAPRVVISGTADSTIGGSGTTLAIANTLQALNAKLILSRAFTTAPAITAKDVTVAANITAVTIPSITTATGTGVFTTNASSNATVGTLTTGSVVMNSAFTVTGTMTVNGSSGLNITQNISFGSLIVSNGDLTINTTTFTGADINVTGNVTVSLFSSVTPRKFVVSGTISSSATTLYLADATDVTGNFTITSGSVYQPVGADVSLGRLIVNNGARIYLFNGTVSYPITFGSGASAINPALFYNSTWPTNTVTTAGTYNDITISGAVTLLNNASVYIVGNATSGKINITGPVTYNGFTITKATGTSGKLFIGGVEVKNATVTNTIGDNLPATALTVDESNTTVLTGNRGTVSVYNGGNLKGTGKANIGNIYYGGALSPGLSPGTITFYNTLLLDDSSIYNVELKSTSEYDKAVVGEQYTGCPTSPVTINSNAILAVQLYSGYTIGTGDRFTIIDNKSSCAITTTFKTLPESGIVVVGDAIFSISYVGGDGNDVVLTTIVAPKTPASNVGVPNTGGQLMALLNPIILAVAAIAVTVVIIIVARRQSTSN